MCGQACRGCDPPHVTATGARWNDAPAPPGPVIAGNTDRSLVARPGWRRQAGRRRSRLGTGRGATVSASAGQVFSLDGELTRLATGALPYPSVAPPPPLLLWLSLHVRVLRVVPDHPRIEGAAAPAAAHPVWRHRESLTVGSDSPVEGPPSTGGPGGPIRGGKRSDSPSHRRALPPQDKWGRGRKTAPTVSAEPVLVKGCGGG